MPKRKPTPFLLRLRGHAGRPGFVLAHLLRRDGPAESCVLYHADLGADVAEELAALLATVGVPVEREASPLAAPAGAGGLFDTLDGGPPQ